MFADSSFSEHYCKRTERKNKIKINIYLKGINNNMQPLQKKIKKDENICLLVGIFAYLETAGTTLHFFM